jgi:hypothetical protein
VKIRSTSSKGLRIRLASRFRVDRLRTRAARLIRRGEACKKYHSPKLSVPRWDADGFHKFGPWRGKHLGGKPQTVELPCYTRIPSTDTLVHEIMKSVSVRPTEPYPTRPVKTIFPVCRRCVSLQKPVGIYLFARTIMRRTLRGKAGRRLMGHSRMVPSCLEQSI